MLDKVRNPNLSRKTDHYHAGPLFDGWAYSKAEHNGIEYLVTRVALRELAVTGRNGIEETRKELDRIVSQITRDTVLQTFEERIVKNPDPRKALTEPIWFSARPGVPNGTPVQIKKVKVFQKMGRGWMKAENAVVIEHVGRSSPDKKLMKHVPYVSHNRYAFLARFRSNGKVVSAESVLRADAYDDYEKEKRFWAKDCEGVFRGDAILLPDDDVPYAIHQIHAGAKLAIAPLVEAGTWEQIQARGSGATIKSAEKDIFGFRVIRA